MTSRSLRQLVTAAALAALITVTTMILPIPSPAGGYVNIGDGFVLLAGWLLGPVYGFASAGIGSALADAFAGYAAYIPGTFVIKGAMALVACLLFRLTEKVPHLSLTPRYLLSGLAGEIIMVLGYFGYACLLLGRGLAAAAGIPGNLVQAGVGLLVGVLLVRSLDKIHVLHHIKG